MMKKKPITRVTRIPQTLEECTYPSKIVSQLLEFAQGLEKMGQWVPVVLILVGFVEAILLGIASEFEDYAVFISILPWFVYGLIAGVAFAIMAMLVKALASITDSSMISANVALLEASKSKAPAVKEVASAEQKPAAVKPAAVKPAAPVKQPSAVAVDAYVTAVKNEDGSWICPKCGQTNLGTRKTCWRCEE